MENVYHIKSVADYFAWRNSKPDHPLVGILDYERTTAYPDYSYDGLQFDCFAVFLKDAKGCKLKYGGGEYDFDEGSMVFMGPGQKAGISYDPDYEPKGYALIFHPDLLLGSDLGRKINSYTFFSYSVKEALHLSARERGLILSVIDKIQYELEQNLDKHSKKLIVSNIELLLDYCLRFYDRQFLTREIPHQGALEKFDMLLNDYLSSEKPQKHGLPSVGYFADQLNLSSNYFGDLVKKEMGYSAQEYIQNKLIDVAKEKVFNPNKSVSEIAYELGFKYPQHFSRLFKKQVGHSPKEFRMLN
ncbi:helix-turn-helix transcriptional regulator [Muricauda sp. CAU 1633]|uniref:helix-turn-helix domain-containing protein n=1 Tax=Allomuricauda sp. CAU 1633 TaxID=2816036 RepID=UPI001A8BF90A|nr:helix-turn-helix transcriptional regulator [Muricauda sp. CAU 1633]MBO0322894.1 helix-turn-helix transcriptional regulator [Muricauda sp. CAU 1633]